MQDSPAATMGSSTSIDAASTGGVFGLMSTNEVWKAKYGTSYFYYNGNKITTSGVKAACIDVSVWNGEIDWAAVKNAGVEYAIIRCGYGQDETSQDDKQWARNVKQAKANGIKLGVYLYSYAYTEGMAAGEAQHTLRCLREAGLNPSDLALPVYYDLEEGGGSPKVGSHSISNLTLARMTAVWCNTIAAEGYNVGVYANRNWWNNYLTNKVFSTSKWSKWVAEYNKTCQTCITEDGKLDSMANYGKYLDIWQFTSSGKCKGNKAASGFIDANWIFNTSFNSANTHVTVDNIIYELNGGKNNKNNPAVVTEDNTTVTLKDPTRAGYAFAGWYTDKGFDEDSKVAQVTLGKNDIVTVYAKWKKITYSISYEIAGTVKSGKNYKASYTITTKTFKLPVPKRKGYGFVGWCKKKACKGKTLSQIKKGSYGNLTLHGKWVKNAKNYRVKSKTLAIRKKTKTSSKCVRKLSKKDVVCITKTKTVKKAKWGYVYKQGWVMLKYTKKL